VIIRDEVDAPDDEVIGSRAAEPIIALKGIVKSYAMAASRCLQSAEFRSSLKEASSSR